jgi:hypothetical protein
MRILSKRFCKISEEENSLESLSVSLSFSLWFCSIETLRESEITSKLATAKS